MPFSIPAIALRPLLPNEEGKRSAPVIFGGYPQLPEALDWPRDKIGRPMHPVLQIDCAGLPAADPDFPAQGTLFLFLALNFEDDEDNSIWSDGPRVSAVLYCAEPTSHLPPRPCPPDTPRLNADAVIEGNPWSCDALARMASFKNQARAARAAEAVCPASDALPRIALEPVAFDSDPVAAPYALADALPAEAGARQRHSIDADWLPELSRIGKRRARGRLTVQLDDGFPWSWSLLRLVALKMSVEFDSRRMEQPTQAATRWMQRAREGLGTALEPETAAEFRGWLASLPPWEDPKYFGQELRDAIRQAIVAVVRSEPDAVAPNLINAIHAEVRWRRSFSPADPPYEDDEQVRVPHQILGYAPHPEEIATLDADQLYDQPSSTRERRLVEDGRARLDGEAMLVQIVNRPHRDEYLALDVPGGMLQIWIDRADLRARRFDRHRFIRNRSRKHFTDGIWRSRPNRSDPTCLAPERVEPAVILKPLLPGEPRSSQSNYFCGWPELPAELAWPRIEGGPPLHFIAQVDCVTLPRALQLNGQSHVYPAFPERGALFLFICCNQDLIDRQDAVRVIHWPEPVTGLPQREPPADTPLLLRENHSAMGGGAPIAWDRRLPFEPVPFASCETVDGVRPTYDDMLFHTLPPEPGAIEYFVYRWPRHAPDIPANYPWCWEALRSACEALAKSSLGSSRTTCLPKDLGAQAARWLAYSEGKDRFAPIDADLGRHFRAWIAGLYRAYDLVDECFPRDKNFDRHWDAGNVVEKAMAKFAEPVPLALHYLLEDAEAYGIPSDLTALAEGELKGQRSSRNGRPPPYPHQMAGYVPALQSAADEHRDDVLLFHINSGGGLTTNWGDTGVAQIWIGREDLAARRFERIVATFESC